jgi:ATP-dependent Lon protease
MAFVGNIDHSIQQVVNSTEHDLFMPLPREFDLAIMDRFACYLPGWEMLKNSTEYLTVNYGFITDYLAEAFHHQCAHTNRYEEVTKRIRLGAAVEGRDEKGIKKTVCAFLKILHPDGPPSDVEFEEYVAYAIECRRRIKEQMNKRKPDDEFAKIGLSFANSSGEEIVVWCPESKNAPATQSPVRKILEEKAAVPFRAGKIYNPDPPVPVDVSDEPVNPEVEKPAVVAQPLIEPQERHYSILYGDTGHTYESIVGQYLPGSTEITVEDPYIRATHQIGNFVRFCEMAVKLGTISKITLITSFDAATIVQEVETKLGDLKQSLLELDVFLDIKIDENLHDRQITLNNGWIVKIGRGLDIYQPPQSYFEVGANDLSLRKCLQTNVDAFKNGAA